MFRRYAVFAFSELFSGRDLFEIKAAPKTVVRLIEYTIGQKTDSGEANERRLAIKEFVMASGYTVGSVGSTSTITPLDEGDPAHLATVRTFGTPSTGTEKELRHRTMNSRNLLRVVYPPELRPEIHDGEACVIRVSTLLVPYDFELTAVFEELGG